MSVLSSSPFVVVLAPVYQCSLILLLHCAVSWINKQTVTLATLSGAVIKPTCMFCVRCRADPGHP